jgi:outer membrane lipoprotein-sorting protein
MMILPIAALITFQGAADFLLRFAGSQYATQTLTAACTQQTVVATASNAPATSFTVALAKPNKARLDLADRLIVADGTTIVVYDKESKTYMRQPETDAALKGLFSNNELGLFGAFFDKTFFDKVRTGKVGKRTRRGVAYDVVDTELDLDGKQSAAIYFDPADKLAKMGEFTFAQDDGQAATLVVIAKELAVGAPQSGDLYTFKAPDGASEITPADLAKANTFVAPAVFQQKALTMMHLHQTDPRGNLPDGGKNCCGPTASTLALSYLGQNGYPNLFQGDDVDALALVGTLAGANYMGTQADGTGPHQMLKGLVKYIGDKGYRIQEAGWESWRSLDQATKGYKLADSIDFDWVRRGIATPNSIVLFNIGWYHADGKGNYERYTGHWIAAAGYGSNSPDGEPNPLLFLIRDPGGRVPELPADPKGWMPFDTVTLTPVGNGQLTGKERGLPRGTNGQYFIGGRGMAGGRDQTTSYILDGVIVIILKPAK